MIEIKLNILFNFKTKQKIKKCCKSSIYCFLPLFQREIMVRILRILFTLGLPYELFLKSMFLDIIIKNTHTTIWKAIFTKKCISLYLSSMKFTYFSFLKKLNLNLNYAGRNVLLNSNLYFTMFLKKWKLGWINDCWVMIGTYNISWI